MLSQAQQRLTQELADQRERGASAATIDALRSRLGDIAATGVMVGSGCGSCRRRRPDPRRTRRNRCAAPLVALLASLLVAVLVAVARDRLRRRGPDADALSRAVELPLIAALPATDVRRSRRYDSGAVDGAGDRGGGAPGCRAARPASARPARRARPRCRLATTAPARVAAALARSLSWGGPRDSDGRARRSRARSTEVPSPGPDVPVVRAVDVDEQLQGLRQADFRYVIVASPRGATGPQLRELAAHAAGTILVARLGSTSVDDAVAARRLMRALGLHGLGLVVTCAAEDAPSGDPHRLRGPVAAAVADARRSQRRVRGRCGAGRKAGARRTTTTESDKQVSNGRRDGRPMRCPYGRPVSVIAKRSGQGEPGVPALVPRPTVAGRPRDRAGGCCAGWTIAATSSWRPWAARSCSPSSRHRAIAARAALLGLCALAGGAVLARRVGATGGAAAAHAARVSRSSARCSAWLVLGDRRCAHRYAGLSSRSTCSPAPARARSWPSRGQGCSARPPPGSRCAPRSSARRRRRRGSPSALDAGGSHQLVLAGWVSCSETPLVPGAPARARPARRARADRRADNDIDLLVMGAEAPRLAVFARGDRLVPGPAGAAASSSSSLFEEVFGHVPTAEINASWFQCLADPHARAAAGAGQAAARRRRRGARRCCSSRRCSAVLVLLVRRDGGPAIFTQVRIGEGGRPFRLHKLRTMRVGAGASAQWACARRPAHHARRAVSCDGRTSTSCRSSSTCCAAR